MPVGATNSAAPRSMCVSMLEWYHLLDVQSIMVGQSAGFDGLMTMS